MAPARHVLVTRQEGEVAPARHILVTRYKGEGAPARHKGEVDNSQTCSSNQTLGGGTSQTSSSNQT